MKNVKTLTLYFFGLLFLNSCTKSTDANNSSASNFKSGTIDSSFGLNGIATVSFGGNNGDVARAACLQSDGKIVIVGNTDHIPQNGGITSHPCFAIARLNTDGSLDNTFSYDGKVTNDITSPNINNCIANAVGILPDGKIIVAGSSSGVCFAIAKYNNDGSPDNSFGINGVIVDTIKKSIPFSNGTPRSSWATAQSIVLQQDGKFIIAGLNQAVTSLTTNSLSLVLVKYNSDGTLDNTFGVNGKSLTLLEGQVRPGSFGLDDVLKINVKLDKFNKLVVLTSNYVEGGSTNVYPKKIFKFNNDGTIDNSFGSSGQILVSNTFYTDVIHSPMITLKNDDNIIVAGSKVVLIGGQSYGSFYAGSYTNNGNISNNFASNGFFSTNFGSTNISTIISLATQSSDNIIFSGRTYDQTYSRTDIALCRVTHNGILDTTFGNSGRLTTQASGSSTSAFQTLLIDKNDKINLITSTSDSYGQFLILRYHK